MIDSRSAKERLVFPLDVPGLDDARVFLRELAGEVGVFKVGLELFCAEGPRAIEAVRDAGAKCFLDLKLHDIPETMAKAVTTAGRHGVNYLTIHCAAGATALLRCAEASNEQLQLLGVTVLTSLGDGDVRDIGWSESTQSAVARLARLALDHRVTGLVCSPHEVSMLRAVHGRDVLLVVPGVRPAAAERDDQKRVATPAQAILDGADLLVVGRPIRGAAHRVDAARAIVAEMAAALAARSAPP